MAALVASAAPLLIALIAISASLGTLHIICKRLETDKEIARMVREARALRERQERRLSAIRGGERAVDEEPFLIVGGPDDEVIEVGAPEDDIIEVGAPEDAAAPAGAAKLAA